LYFDAITPFVAKVVAFTHASRVRPEGVLSAELSGTSTKSLIPSRLSAPLTTPLTGAIAAPFRGTPVRPLWISVVSVSKGHQAARPLGAGTHCPPSGGGTHSLSHSPVTALHAVPSSQFSVLLHPLVGSQTSTVQSIPSPQRESSGVFSQPFTGSQKSTVQSIGSSQRASTGISPHTSSSSLQKDSVHAISSGTHGGAESHRLSIPQKFPLQNVGLQSSSPIQQFSIGAPAQAPTSSQTSLSVQNAPSSHASPSRIGFTHPVAGSQSSWVHWFPSAQSTSARGTEGQPSVSQSPVSSMVHAFPSSQSNAHTSLQGPRASPWSKCADSAFSLTLMV
jgi:hypothetical protein